MKNTIENIIIAVIAVAVAAALLYFTAILPQQKQNQRNFDKIYDLVETLALVEKYKIENNFDKIKSTKDSKIVLDLNNKLNTLTQNQSAENSAPPDTIVEPERKGFFKRLFD